MRRNRQQGFSLIELMVVMVIFLIVTGTLFGLLDASQVRYRAEKQLLESFQGARLGMDLMVRDMHNAGYPPAYTFAGNLGTPPTPATYPPGTWTVPALAPADLQRRFAVGILGIGAAGVNPNCTVNGGATPCLIPNANTPWDLILELDIDPENPLPDPITGLTPQVEWVRYTLQRPGGAATSTLFRTVGPKVAGVNPAAQPVSNIPFVENVVQDPAAGVGANNPALFTYECDPKYIVVPGTQICTAEHVKNVYISLQVRSTRGDIRTGQFRQITLQGEASRLNPSR